MTSPNRASSAIRRSCALALLALVLAATACTSEGAREAEPGSWVVERTTDGDATTVRNISGSKWGGNAKLEVALEIGVAEGDERYMLARPFPLTATDEEIFVFEGADGRVRVYGRDGVHRRDFGRSGEGPGEFGSNVLAMSVIDEQVVVASLAGLATKLSFFSLEGDFVDEWSAEKMMGGGGLLLIPSLNGLVQTPTGIVSEFRETPTAPGPPRERRRGWITVSGEGPVGEPWFLPPVEEPPATYSVNVGPATVEQPAPFTISSAAAAIAPTGERIWGDPHEYRFTIARPDGSKMVVERVTDPIAIHPDEADYHRRRVVAMQRRRNPDFTWDGSEIPPHKPWFSSILTDRLGRIWISRAGPGRRVEGCTEPEDAQPGVPSVACWPEDRILDVFDLEGSFLGQLERPEGLQITGPFFGKGIIVASHEDEFGTPKVRVYRIVLPAESSDVLSGGVQQ